MQVGIRELQAKERGKHGQLLQLKLFLKDFTRYMIEEYNYMYRYTCTILYFNMVLFTAWKAFSSDIKAHAE